MATKLGQPAPTPLPSPAPPAPPPADPASMPGPSLDDVFADLRSEKKLPELPEHVQNNFDDLPDSDLDPDISSDERSAGISEEVTAEYYDDAMMWIGFMDMGIGAVGSLVTGREATRYHRFNEKEPPKHFVRATAAVIAKYQATMGPEFFFFTALAAAYSPSVAQIRKDIKAKRIQDAKAAEQQQGRQQGPGPARKPSA